MIPLNQPLLSKQITNVKDGYFDELIDSTNILYEDRLIKIHERNKKYISQAKRQLQGIEAIPLPMKSHVSLYQDAFNKNEFVSKLQVLEAIYIQKVG